MMKPMHTALMVLVLALLGGYVYLYESKPQDPATAEASTKPKQNILVIDKAKLKQIEVDQNAPAASTVLTRVGDKWTVDGKPADQARLDSLLTQIETWQAADTLEESFNKAQATDFGLEPPDLILRIKAEGVSDTTIKIGAKTPTSSGYYLIKDGDPKLYLSYVGPPEELRRLITQPPLASSSPAAVVSPAAGPQN
ncbi:MAG: hypothetical protein CVV27_05575 [Candidatus Melainabacteria bacterium HGW-Melainabacteria-1]|nr:MAG: hypothetical protein CVV27_05575 [Candidatus Melainabacteria bacterium HGW-Melainabacteria-1]